jgi:DNA-binding response OmpR family regulator
VRQPEALQRSVPSLSGLTILVVEDDSDSRNLLRDVFQARGATVLEAEEVLTAQQYLRTLKVDLVVTDLALPGRDGVSLLSWLRSQPHDRGGTIPTVAVTAYDKRYPPGDFSGWAAYFRKPLDLDEVVRTIAAILRPPSAASGPSATAGRSE